ncbi:unnamed protein product, partial [Polarella glacialis]
TWGSGRAMSLLLEDVERRWQTRLDLKAKDHESELRSVLAKCRLFETELTVESQRAIAAAEAVAREASRREQDASAATGLAEQQLEAERRRAEAERRSFEEVLGQEREEKHNFMARMEQEMQRIQEDAITCCRRMQERLDQAHADSARALREASERGKQAQLGAERRAKLAEAHADEAAQANRALSAAIHRPGLSRSRLVQRRASLTRRSVAWRRCTAQGSQISRRRELKSWPEHSLFLRPCDSRIIDIIVVVGGQLE